MAPAAAAAAAAAAFASQPFAASQQGGIVPRRSVGAAAANITAAAAAAPLVPAYPLLRTSEDAGVGSGKGLQPTSLSSHSSPRCSVRAAASVSQRLQAAEAAFQTASQQASQQQAQGMSAAAQLEGFLQTRLSVVSKGSPTPYSPRQSMQTAAVAMAAGAPHSPRHGHAHGHSMLGTSVSGVAGQAQQMQAQVQANGFSLPVLGGRR